MLRAPEWETLPVQIAYLEGRLQQVFEECSQLGQWQESDQHLLAAVQAHTAQVSAALATSCPRDHQVRSALTELVVIGHIQQFLLEHTLEQAAGKCSHLREEGALVRQALGLLHRTPTPEEGGDDGV